MDYMKWLHEPERTCYKSFQLLRCFSGNVHASIVLIGKLAS